MNDKKLIDFLRSHKDFEEQRMQDDSIDLLNKRKATGAYLAYKNVLDGIRNKCFEIDKKALAEKNMVDPAPTKDEDAQA